MAAKTIKNCSTIDAFTSHRLVVLIRNIFFCSIYKLFSNLKQSLDLSTEVAGFANHTYLTPGSIFNIKVQYLPAF